MNPAQLAFLAAHGHGIPPHDWAWLDAEGRSVTQGPGTWVTLRARKQVGSGVKSFLISREDLAGLEPYWDQPLLQVNAAGMALLAAALVPVES